MNHSISKLARRDVNSGMLIPVSSRFLASVYSQLLEVDPGLAKELMRQIKDNVANSNERNRKARVGRILGSEGSTRGPDERAQDLE